MSPGAPFPIETYSLVLAHLLRRRHEPTGVVLESLHLSADDLRRAEVHWNHELSRCYKDRKGVLAMKFASALGEALERLGQADPDAVAPPPLVPALAAAPATPDVPSFLRPGGEPPGAPPPPPAPAPPHPSEDVAGTADVSAFVPRGALPFAAPVGAPVTMGPQAAPYPGPAEPAPHPPPAGSGTEDITAYVPRSATPFHGGAVEPAAQPRMRLIRFDPQTGQPLAEPRWEPLQPDPGQAPPPKR